MTAAMTFSRPLPWLLGMEYKHKSLTLGITSEESVEINFITI
jgi:hypothetical protein